jgi:hypothetical protein
MTTLRDNLIAAGGPHEEAEAAQQGEAGRRIAALEKAVIKLRQDVMFARYAALVAVALAVGLFLRSFLQG